MEKEIKFLGKLSTIIGAFFVCAAFFISFLANAISGLPLDAKCKDVNALIYGIFFLVAGMLMLCSNIQSYRALGWKIWMSALVTAILIFIQNRYYYVSLFRRPLVFAALVISGIILVVRTVKRTT